MIRAWRINDFRWFLRGGYHPACLAYRTYLAE